jgi:hypothetical protein
MTLLTIFGYRQKMAGSVFVDPLVAIPAEDQYATILQGHT